MKRAAFEQRVLEIWMRSRVPLTLAHTQHLTGAPRDRTRQWLEAMTVDSLLEADVGDDGEMVWQVRGAARPATGPENVAELERLERLTVEVGATATGRSLAHASRAAGLARRGDGDKSVIASGGLSLIFGPLGWLYAAPLKEALPGIAIYMLACSIVPSFLLWPLLGILGPVSALAGVYYAWRHNQTGERTGLFTDKPGKIPKSPA